MGFNETEHYKNVTALEKMIQKIIGMGTTYNPSKTSIKLTALQALLTQAKADYSAVSPATVPYNNAINDRIIIFQPYKSYSTQILATFKSSSDANPQKIKDLTTINRKIQGARAPKKDTSHLYKGLAFVVIMFLAGLASRSTKALAFVVLLCGPVLRKLRFRSSIMWLSATHTLAA